MDFVTKMRRWLFNNQATNQTIAKNTFWLLFGQMAGRLLRATIVIYAARVLGAASWGNFSYALGMAAFLTTLSDIGINALITKEASRNPALKDQYLSTAFWTKILLLAVLAIAVVLGGSSITRNPETMSILPIIIFVFAFDTLRDLGSAVSRALEKMEIEAGVNIFTNLVIAVAGFAFLLSGTGIKGLATAYALGSGAGLAVILYALRHHFKNVFTHFNKKLVKEIVLSAWPFGLMGLMGIINLNTDIVMLGWMRAPEEVGYYSAAQKVIQLLYILPAVFASSVFPAFTKMVKTDATQARRLLKRSLVISLVAAFIIALIGLLGSKLIILSLYGASYLPAFGTLEILMATLLIVYPSMHLANAAYAYDQQKSLLLFVLVSFFGNVLFNALLIPRLGIEGAALSTLVTQFITNLFIWRRVNQLVKQP